MTVGQCSVITDQRRGEKEIEAGDRATNDAESMQAKKVLAVAAAAALVLAAELALYLRFRLSRPFYLSTAGVLSASAVAALLLLLKKRGFGQSSARRRALEHGEEDYELRGVEYSFFRKVAGLPSKFSLEALALATDNFQCVAGRGSSGTVFRGLLDDGTPVAVKRIDSNNRAGSSGSNSVADREFKAEVAAIAGAQHVNLVRLLGFSLSHPRSRFLVYEFMEHGSLNRWIFPRPLGSSGGGCLPWAQRRQVAVDVAKALAYLHHDCRATVLHLDVKPENVLLDGGFRGILSDFGLSKLVGKEQSRVVTAVRGTTGYLAPEWLLGAGVTAKSDVYSYGIVLLEMVAGRRSMVREEEEGLWSYLPRIAADVAREGRVMEMLDKRLVREVSAAEEAAVRRMVHVALWCAQERAGERPTMARVVEMLEGRGVLEEVEAPPPSDMVMVDLLALDRGRGGGGPFGLPARSAASSSVLSECDSFKLSYLTGR